MLLWRLFLHAICCMMNGEWWVNVLDHYSPNDNPSACKAFLSVGIEAGPIP